MRQRALAPTIKPFLRPGAFGAVILQDAPVIGVIHESFQFCVWSVVRHDQALGGVGALWKECAHARQSAYGVSQDRRHPHILGSVEHHDAQRPFIGGGNHHITLLDGLADILRLERPLAQADFDHRVDF